MAPSPLELLADAVSADGGFGYHRGQPTHLEPTCLGLLALAAEPERFAPQLSAALEAIRQHAQPDGSYRLTRGRQQAVWPTALVLFTRGLLNHSAAEIQPIANKLLGIEGKVVRLETSDAGDIDAGLLGWPWAEDTFSWVEPTAWACLALRAVGLGEHPRVQEGLRLLLDRAFDHGGANYGSRMILGKQTEPIPGSTCALLLALQGVKDNTRIEAAKGYLRVVANQTNDLETLAWVKLALSVHADDTATLDALPLLEGKITGSLAFEAGQTNGLGAGPFRHALAALALNTASRNPFRLADTPAVATHAVVGSTREPAKDEPVRAGSEASGFLGKLKAGVQNFLLRGTAAIRPLPVTSAVHIARAESYDVSLTDLLQTQFAHFRQFVPVAGKRVVLKPNLVEFHRDRVINTHPKFVGAVIDLFQREGAAEVVVAEGPGHWRNAQFLVSESGLGDELRARGVRFVDVNHDEPVKVTNVGRTTGLEFLYLSKTIAEAEVFVSLPKLKTHHWAGATLSLKNLFGILPGICYGWPKNELHWRGIPNSIVDIALTHTPHLAIIDGVVGMEGDGPLAGNAKYVGAVVMGLDPLAVDATGCRLMSLPPERLPTLRLAEQKRLGVLKEELIPQLGEPIASMAQAFEMPPEIEKQLVPSGK
ncbi:MAG: DUF362 domain-containing protein [Fimbriiglobus sp.]|nr:DUF362 domain-containing protein [Fimbriiglobus sp.]